VKEQVRVHLHAFDMHPTRVQLPRRSRNFFSFLSRPISFRSHFHDVVPMEDADIVYLQGSLLPIAQAARDDGNVLAARLLSADPC
jgi:hypothetical protein